MDRAADGYRAEEAKRLVRDSRRRGQKILAIAFDADRARLKAPAKFNNKSL